MPLPKSLLPKHHHFHSLLKTDNFPSLVLTKTLTSSPQIEPESDSTTNSNKKPLVILFKEAVGLCDADESEPQDSDSENSLVALGREIRRLKSGEKPKRIKKENEKREEERPKTAAKRLHNLFLNSNSSASEDNTKRDIQEPRIFKQLSPEMEAFVTVLHKEGYLNKANFLPRNGKWDFGCFEDGYARDFIKFAAEKFGKEHQDIAKWLSGSDLKKVALFGCPSTARKNVFSAKRLRNYFEIPEDNVCGKCVLKDSCKFINQSIWKGDTKNLNLAVVMRVITLYAMEEVPTQLAVPDDIKDSVNNLLKDITNLSQAKQPPEATWENI